MTTAQVVETSVTVNDNSPIQDYVNPDDQTQPTFDLAVSQTASFLSIVELYLGLYIQKSKNNIFYF